MVQDRYDERSGSPPEFRERQGDGGERAAHAAGEASHRAQDALRGGAERGREQLADRVENTSREFHRFADELGGGSEAWLGEFVDYGARQLDGLAQSLKSSDSGGLMRSAQQFARDNPAVFLGASVALGFALVRMGRAASGGNDSLASSASRTFGRNGGSTGRTGSFDRSDASSGPFAGTSSSERSISDDHYAADQRPSAADVGERLPRDASSIGDARPVFGDSAPGRGTTPSRVTGTGETSSLPPDRETEDRRPPARGASLGNPLASDDEMERKF